MLGSRFVRQSKVRHVFADQPKPDFCYTDIRLTHATGDHNYIKANSTHFAVSWGSGGGGSLAVIPFTQLGRQQGSMPMIKGHGAPVTDFDFCPVSDGLLATGSQDATVKVWNVEGGVTKNLSADDALLSLEGHTHKILGVKWHPTASNVLHTTSMNECTIWDVSTGEEKVHLEGHGGLIQDSAYSFDGSILATSCKDKQVRLFDPRTDKATGQMQAHDGAKTSKLCWLGNKGQILTCGFTKQSKRQFKIWDPKSMDKPIATCQIDSGAGVLMPFWDEALNMLYLCGKGDGNIRYYELTDTAPFYYLLNEFRSSASCKGAGVVPRRVLNTSKCEVFRVLKLTSNQVQPLSFIVPRKSTLFQADIYPDARSAAPSLSSDDFFAGKNGEPLYQSMDPKKKGAASAISAGAAAAIKGIGTKKTYVQLQKELTAANARIAELEAEVAKLKA